MRRHDNGFMHARQLFKHVYLFFDWDWKYFGLGFQISDSSASITIAWMYLSVEY